MAEQTNAEIRTWARENGYEVADRGRIRAAVLAAHAAAHAAPAVDETPPAPAGSGPTDPATVQPRLVRRGSARPGPGAGGANGDPAAPAPVRRRPVVTRSAAPPSDLAPDPDPPAPSGPAASETPAPGDPRPATVSSEPTGPPPPPPSPSAWTAPTAPAPRPAWGAPPGPPPGWGAQPPAGPPPSWGTAAPGQGGAPGGAWPSPEPPKGHDGFAIAALVFGLLPFFAGLLGIAFGLVGLQRTKRSHQKGRGFAIAGIVLGSGWIVGAVVLVAVGVLNQPGRGSDGSVTSSGTVTIDDIRMGDCLGSLPDRPATDFRLVPCDQPHVAEVFGIIALKGSSFPGEAEVERLGDEGCAERLPGYVGPARASAYVFGTFSPTSLSWRSDHREVHCLLMAPNGARLPGGSAEAP